MGIKLRDLGGYGDIPDDDDPGVRTLRCRRDAPPVLAAQLRTDGSRRGWVSSTRTSTTNRLASAYWRTMLAGLTFLEMEETGVTVDVERGKELIKVFEMVKERLDHVTS